MPLGGIWTLKPHFIRGPQEPVGAHGAWCSLLRPPATEAKFSSCAHGLHTQVLMRRLRSL